MGEGTPAGDGGTGLTDPDGGGMEGRGSRTGTTAEKGGRRSRIRTAGVGRRAGKPTAPQPGRTPAPSLPQVRGVPGGEGPAAHAATPATTPGRIQVGGRPAAPAAQAGAEGGSVAGVRRLGVPFRDCAPGSRPPGQHPSPQRRLPARRCRLPHGSPGLFLLLPPLRLSGLASRARKGWPRQPRFPCSSDGGCGGRGGDLARHWRRGRQRPRRRRRHLGNRRTPRPWRRKPGRRGGAGLRAGQPIGGVGGTRPPGNRVCAAAPNGVVC